MQPVKRTLEHCVSSEPPAKFLKHADAEIKEDDPRSEGEEVVDVVVPENDQSCHSQLKSGACKVVETKENNSSSQEHSGLDVQEYEHYQEGDREECASSPLKYWDAVLPHVHKRTVSVGPEHQADIPPWNPTSEVDKDEEARWCSGRIYPRYDEEVVDQSRQVQCKCEDSGSIECVRLHIEESRKVVAAQLGPAFYKLGFEDMGESVASHWTEEEENTFREVVRLNPASQKRDFWTLFPSALPNKSRKELVSYYFNVFVLRRRALQNRFTPRNCDSDDDEADPTCYEDESEWEYPEMEDEEFANWRRRVHEQSDCDSDAAPDLDVKVYAPSEGREEAEAGREEEDEEEEEEEDPEEQEDEFHKENSAGTEAEIKRLATLGGNDVAWLPSSSPLELASTNGAMQEFFGEPSY